MNTIDFGPRLIGTPTGKLRSALLVRPTASIESATPLPGEPGAVYSRALEQHDVLRKTLEYFGVQTIVLEPSGDDPFETVATDAAITFEDGAVIARPSDMSRRPQTQRFEAAFAEIDVPLAGHIVAPGLFDAGDALLVGSTAFVGVGMRANTLGREGFAAVARAHGYRVVEVRLAAGVRSLRSVMSAVAKDTLVVAPDCVDLDALEGFKVVAVARGEDMGAGVLCIGENHVLADVRYRTALATMRRAGIVVEGIDLYDFEKVGITPSMLVLALKRD